MGNRQWRAALALFGVAIVPPLFAALPATAAEQPPGVVINEAYVNGGSANAAYKNKFVELYNSSSQAVNLDGWSIQYRPATGTGAATGIASLSGK
ncbi:MAG: lamin tail domain-containing protein, partial [Sinomonas sp.]|nr:lamin tail domain-containing protein [Sinomonas sp.]